ncbi:MAG: hypothetical protein GX167_02385 [Firmicutes bacterium]|nr:hypothetical protein [Bacillota bacterium]
MKVVIPPPLTQPPPEESFWTSFLLLLKTQLRVSMNKIKHWPFGVWLAVVSFGLSLTSVFVYLGVLAYRAMLTMNPDTAGGFLSLLFMICLSGLVFFGITAAFVTRYMSEDLELLFVSPIPLRVVFAVKSVLIATSNFLTALLFAFLPGIFYGLLFKAGAGYYFLILLVGLGLWFLGTAFAELLNLVVMRLVPPHRSREAVGLIGGVAGVFIALVFQIPSMVMAKGGRLDIGSWLAGRQSLLQAMQYFPWGWGARALISGITCGTPAGLGWSLLLLLFGIVVFFISFTFMERGFRRGWISFTSSAARRRRQAKQHASAGAGFTAMPLTAPAPAWQASAWNGMWAVVKKDLLYLKRDMREWFGYLIPLIIMVFFIVQYLFLQVSTAQSSLISVLFMYTLMFSSNMALQAFGREGEADWLLNSVPLSGWPVVWGKLLGAVLPTLLLMEALLAGTAIAIGLSASMTLMLAVGAVLLSFGASAIGLFYSISNARYNPDNPQHRISPGASLIMYLINLLFLLLLGFTLLYLIPPAELLAVLPLLPEVPPPSNAFLAALLKIVIFITTPFKWSAPARIASGLLVTGAVWSAFFFGFMAATVRQSRKGFHVEIVKGLPGRKTKMPKN